MQQEVKTGAIVGKAEHTGVCLCGEGCQVCVHKKSSRKGAFGITLNMPG